MIEIVKEWHSPFRVNEDSAFIARNSGAGFNWRKKRFIGRFMLISSVVET